MKFLAILAGGLPPPTLPKDRFQLTVYSQIPDVKVRARKERLLVPSPYLMPANIILDLKAKRVTIWKNIW